MPRNPSNSSKGEPRPQQRGSAHGMWKGDDVGLQALHDWVHLRLPRPDTCQKCGGPGPLDLHNIDKKYTRDLTKWIYLCKKCHAKEEAPARAASQTPTARKKRSESMMGHPVSETTRENISSSRKKEWATVPEEVKTERLKNFIKHPKPRVIRKVPCACGCGATLETPDSQGRERTCIRGHNVTPKIGRKYPSRKSPRAEGGA